MELAFLSEEQRETRDLMDVIIARSQKRQQVIIRTLQGSTWDEQLGQGEVYKGGHAVCAKYETTKLDNLLTDRSSQRSYK